MDGGQANEDLHQFDFGFHHWKFFLAFIEKDQRLVYEMKEMEIDDIIRAIEEDEMNKVSEPSGSDVTPQTQTKEMQ